MNTKKCTKCLKEKTIEFFSMISKRGKPYIKSRCIECLNEINKQARKIDKERFNQYAQKARSKKRLKLINAYGGKCVCCNENRPEFLCIDHINNNGAKMRRKHGNGISYTDFLIKNNYPKGHQVLCHNCNMSKGFYGYCPHQNSGKDYFISVVKSPLKVYNYRVEGLNKEIKIYA